MPRKKPEDDGSTIAVLDAPDAPVEEPEALPERDYELWEVLPLDASVARQLRLMLLLDEDQPVPGSVLKVLADFQAEPSGDVPGEGITVNVLKWAIQIADLKYPMRVEIPCAIGEFAYSKYYARKVRYCRPAALGRAIIEFSGQLHAVPVGDLIPD